jgi:uroporphyrinogen-III synthase
MARVAACEVVEAPSSPADRGLAGLRVLAFERRRETAMAELIRRHAGRPTIAPALREQVRPDPAPALACFDQLASGTVETLILLTGVGLTTFVTLLASRGTAAEVAGVLGRVQLIARGPKPVAALRTLGLTPTSVAPPPHTWRELLAVLAPVPLAGQTVGVLEYGIPNQQLLAGLEARGATALRVPVYSWELPEDLEPLQAAARALVAGSVEVVLFTSATQVYHLFRVAADQGITAAALRVGLAQASVASIGPVCSEALRDHGVEPRCEPSQGKMGQLVAAAAAVARADRLADC